MKVRPFGNPEVTSPNKEMQMCNQCPTITADRICTHKDYDKPCGCVECLYCEITMIRCMFHTTPDDLP